MNQRFLDKSFLFRFSFILLLKFTIFLNQPHSVFWASKIGPILYWKEKMDEFIYHQISKFCNITFFILEQKIIHEVKKWFHVILAVSHLAECPLAKNHFGQKFAGHKSEDQKSWGLF